MKISHDDGIKQYFQYDPYELTERDILHFIFIPVSPVFKPLSLTLDKYKSSTTLISNIRKPFIIRLFIALVATL